jgi:hypothetical protein
MTAEVTVSVVNITKETLAAGNLIFFVQMILDAQVSHTEYVFI